jgi:hypothetical protein
MFVLSSHGSINKCHGPFVTIAFATVGSGEIATTKRCNWGVPHAMVHAKDTTLMERNFPAPWTVVEAVGEFFVRDATGLTLCHFYWWGGATGQLTQYQARHLAERFATLAG